MRQVEFQRGCRMRRRQRRFAVIGRHDADLTWFDSQSLGQQLTQPRPADYVTIAVSRRSKTIGPLALRPRQKRPQCRACRLMQIETCPNDLDIANIEDTEYIWMALVAHSAVLSGWRTTVVLQLYRKPNF